MSELCNYCLHLLLKPQEEDFNKTSSKQFQMWRNISRISGSFSSKWGLKVPLMEENFFPRKQSAEETNNVIGFKGHGHAERRVFSVFCTCVFVFVFEWRCVCAWIWMTLCLCLNLNGIVIGFKGHGHAERRVFSALFERHCMVYNVYIRLYLSFIVFEWHCVIFEFERHCIGFEGHTEEIVFCSTWETRWRHQQLSLSCQISEIKYFNEIYF